MFAHSFEEGNCSNWLLRPFNMTLSSVWHVFYFLVWQHVPGAFKWEMMQSQLGARVLITCILVIIFQNFQSTVLGTKIHHEFILILPYTYNLFHLISKFIITFWHGINILCEQCFTMFRSRWHQWTKIMGGRIMRSI